MSKSLNLKTPKGKCRRQIPSITSPDDKALQRLCIIHYDNSKTDFIGPLTEYSFSKIIEVAKLRKQENDPKKNLEYITVNLPSSFNPELHGAHRWCYQQFTNVQRLKRAYSEKDTKTSEPAGPSRHSKQRRISSETTKSAALFPNNKCIFCDKETLTVKRIKQPLIKCITKTSEASIKDAAELKNDDFLLCQIRDVDLVAREAHYHNHCRRSYTRSDSRHTAQENEDSNTSNILNGHKKAFDYICDYTEEYIISKLTVEKVGTLRERYLLYLLENSPDIYNANYKNCELKSKLQYHFGSRLRFWQPAGQGELVYSVKVGTGQALETAFELAMSDEKRVEEAAFIVRRHIFETQKSSEDMPWPPSASWLTSESTKTPQLLDSFLSRVVSKRQSKASSSRVERFVKSCSQNICYATTNGSWTMPKHLLLAMTVRHLTGSSELITILNRFGHCVSYSCILELETAMCNSINTSNSVLPSTISRTNNGVVHLSWDNFDLNEETPSGSGTTHTAHGIIIQEVLDSSIETTSTESDVPKTKQRTVCFAKPKAEPEINAMDTLSTDTISKLDAHNLSEFIWMYCRKTTDMSTVPSWAGWLSATSFKVQHTCSIVDYMAPVNNSITENATVQHVLQISQKATECVGQKYTIFTCDLAVAKKAYSIVWQDQQFKNVIVRIGVFHTICSLFGVLGKRMTGSGLSDLLIESGICASGSLNKVLSGKHYNRALRVHKLTLEALERLLFMKFETTDNAQETFLEETKTSFKLLSENPNNENLRNVSANPHCLRLYDAYMSFKDEVRKGRLGKTPQYWINYMDIVWTILKCIKATKENDLDMHISSLYELCPLFFAYDHHNYARYVPVYLTTLMNLNHTHPGAEHMLRSTGFSVSRSDVPMSRNAVDITIEQTINRHAKSHGGIIGFSRNYAAYYRWCVTRHSRAQYLEATLNMADIITPGSSDHKELRSSQMKSDDQDVKKVVAAFNSFLNPFTIEQQDELYCLSSGVPTPSNVANDLLEAYGKGVTARDDFVKERLVEKTRPFHDPIRRLKLKTFASVGIVKKVQSSQKKMIEIRAERNIFGQLVLLSMKHQIDLQMALSFPLGPVPWSLATADGSPVKTDKSKLLHILEGTIQPTQRPEIAKSIYIMDGNAILQSFTCVPETFGDLAESVFNVLPKTKRVDFVTDSYNKDSIKSFERKRRGTSSTFLIAGPRTKTPKDWKGFMSNGENKTQLIKLLFDEWKKDKNAIRLFNRQLFFVCGEDCFLLTCNDQITINVTSIPELTSSQEEADTRIILHCKHAAESTVMLRSTILVRSPDTDVLVLLTKFAINLENDIIFDTGAGNKRRLLSVNRIITDQGPEICDVLPAVHAFTGCDTTSAFVRRGKSGPLKLLKKHQEYIAAFKSIGEDINVTDRTITTLEKFVCCMYGKPKYANVNKLRFDMFSQRFQTKQGDVLSSYDGVDLSLLPPCKDTLRMHILRTNYQALIWNKADVCVPNIPSPVGNGWKIEDAQLYYDWIQGAILPQELVDIVCESKDIFNTDENDDIEVEANSFLDIVYDDNDD